MTQKQILCVEDNDSNMRLVSRIVEGERREFLTAADGATALAMAQRAEAIGFAFSVGSLGVLAGALTTSRITARIGVGRMLVAMAVDKGRAVRPGIEVGVCGEHGGDPASVAFFHHAGLPKSCRPAMPSSCRP